MAVKRPRLGDVRADEGGGSTSGLASTSGSVVVSKVREEMAALGEAFRRVEQIASNAADRPGEGDEAALREAKEHIGECVRRIIDGHKAMSDSGAGRSEEAAQVNRALDALFKDLEESTFAVGDKLDAVQSSDIESLSSGLAAPSQWRNLVGFAHRLSFTTFAPAGYVPGDPRWGLVGPFAQPAGQATGFWHCSPPAPQKWHMDTSVVHNHTVAKSEAERSSRSEEMRDVDSGGDRSGGEVKHDSPPVHNTPQNGEKAELALGNPAAAAPAPKGGKPLHDMVDFVLNPDLEEGDDLSIVSEEEFSSSSD